MSTHQSDAEIIARTHNTARYFTETRSVAWVLLIGTILWGIYAYATMPKRKDPEIPVRTAAAIVRWPGATAEKIEELVTKRVEEKIAESSKVEKLESTTRTGVAVVLVTLHQSVSDTGKELDDIRLKLDTLKHLPQGATLDFQKDFGETAALMLTIASPKVSDVELQIRATRVRRAIEETRTRAAAAPTAAAAAPGTEHDGARVSLVVSFPFSMSAQALGPTLKELAAYASERGARDVEIFEGPGFLGVDARTRAPDEKILATARAFVSERMGAAELHPDVWDFAVVRDPATTEAALAAVAGDKYSYRDLEEITDKIKTRLQTAPLVAKVTRAGVLPEQVFLDFSQERLASYGIAPAQIRGVLGARNITAPGGVLEVQGKSVIVNPSGELRSAEDIGGIAVATSETGAPVYMRDLVQVTRGYMSPAPYLNAYTSRDASGAWRRGRAVTLAVTMRSGGQIGDFGAQVDAALADVRALLPEDLIAARTSNQPKQVAENVELFMSSLYEAIALVVLVALVGFWEWRSALLMALSIPVTLMMTFGFMRLVGLDLQQVSIASLIIALGLLVDDPVVAGDAIKRDLALGHPPSIAAWLGPTKLATAILFATITNIVAYLPFLSLPDDAGRFIFSLPIVLTASLVASRLVSMTFIPLLGMYLLRAPRVVAHAAPKPSRFKAGYKKVVGWAIDHRGLVLVASLIVLGFGVSATRGVKNAYFPKDLSYLSYVDVWLPEDAPLSATRDAATLADVVIRDAAQAYGVKHPGEDGKPRDVLQSVTTFIGGGGPRFWFSVAPEQRQPNYAQLVLQVKDKHDTAHLIPELQDALSRKVPGARIDVRQLETGAPVGVPVSIRIAGDDVTQLRALAERVKTLFLSLPNAERPRDNWGADTFSVGIDVDPDRANLAGVTNLDVAQSSAVALNGSAVGVLREGDLEIPIVARLRASERSQISDLQNLYVRSSQTPTNVPLRQVSQMSYRGATEKIVRRNHSRTITVACFPVPGTLPSEVMNAARAQLTEISASLPPGYSMTIGGEEEEQKKGFKNLAVVMVISIACIFLALVIQFKSAIKPLIVFAAIPYGAVGALATLALMRAPFGFMAFLGVISLVGVIVSHVIVLFDFIEEQRAEGAPLREALIDAGIARLRPVLITVGATVFGLFPLAAHGGPLWEPLCYVQIGGLTIATVITLLIVPVLYAIFVLDLRVVSWSTASATSATEQHGAEAGEAGELHGA